MSPGSEDYNLPPAPELVDHVDRHITPKRELQGYLKFSGLLGASTLSESATSHCVASSSRRTESCQSGFS